MKNWQVLALCFSIIVSVAASAFYLKYEPRTIIESDSGTVDLGKVFSEQVTIDVILIHGSDDEQVLANNVNFYDSSKPVVEGIIKLNNRRYHDKNVEDEYKLKYNELNGIRINAEDVKIRTYITYFSSNFSNKPYVFLVGEKTYGFKGYLPLADSIPEIVNKDFEANKDDVANKLFMSDK
tara:strand:- start:7125 stop:7664 length:540 start_codon:yes stop_codon:yes gene_type:complete